MSKLEDLIQELCSNGVEYKTLDELGTFYGGLTGKSKEDFKDGNAKFISYVNVFNNLAIDTSTSDNVKIGERERQNTIQYGDIIFTGSSETKEECGMSSVLTQETEENLYLNSFCFGLRLNNLDILLPDYAKYVFRSNKVRKQIIKTASGVTRFNVSKTKMQKVSIPVPPMPVQEEIVRILDSFTELTEELIEELTEELIARKKQYEYYRDELLTFGDDVEWKNLGEMFEVKNGLNKEKSAFGKGYPIVNFTDVYNKRWLDKSSLKGLVKVTPDETYRYSAKKGDVFFTRTSETREDIGMSSTLIEDIPNCVFSGFVLRARPTTGLLLPKFCSYYFSTPQVRKDIIRYASFTTRATTTGSKLSKIKIPLPSLDEQQRIVDILDRFDKLCNDISEDLPAEIEARKKQYKYYRDKLLTFK